MSHLIQIITPPESHTLVQLDAVKLQLGITNSGSDDLLNAFIAGASAIIESYLGRPILTQEVKETWRQMSWKARDSLVTSYSPIIELTSATENGVDLSVDTDFEVEYQTGVFYRVADGFRYRWGHEVVIQYTTGYDDVPTVIAQVCADLVGAAYYTSQRDPTIQREDTEGVGKTMYFPGHGTASFVIDDMMKVSLAPFMAIIP